MTLTGSDQFHGIAFVIVEASLHGDDELSSEIASDEVAFVSDGRRYRETRDGPVGDDDGILYAVGELAEPAAEDDAGHGGAASQLLAYERGRGIDLFNSGVHGYSF